MAKLSSLLAIILCLVGCYHYRHGYKVKTGWTSYHVLWEHPVNLDSDEEQVIDVPFIKYGDYFSLCFDKNWKKSATLPDSAYYLPNDFMNISFHIEDTVLVGEVSHDDESCPNGHHLLWINVPEDFNREQGGQLHIRVRKRLHFKNNSTARIVQATGHSWE